MIKFLITDWLFSFSLDSCQSVKRDEIFLLYVYNAPINVKPAGGGGGEAGQGVGI